MRFRIIVTAILTAPLWLSTSVKAETSFQFKEALAFQPSILLAQSNWREFSSTEGGFAVSMPGTPKEETATDKKGSVDHSFSLTLDKAAYFIHYTDIADIKELSNDQKNQLLDVVPAQFIEGGKAKLEEEPRSIDIKGHPGKEFKFTLSDGTPGICRVYMVEARLYLVLGMTADVGNYQKFVNSFRLL